MHVCRLAMASVLLGMAVSTPSAVSGASLNVGITIVQGCGARTMNYFDTPAATGTAVQTDCPANTPYSVAVGDRAMEDGRSRPPVVPQDTHLVSVDQRFRIATMTF